MPVDLVVSWHRAFHLIHMDHLMTTDPYYGQPYDNGIIENAYPADPPEEDVDYAEGLVTNADGTTSTVIIRRPRP